VALRLSGVQLRIVDPPGIGDVIMRCVCDEFEIPDREGRTGLWTYRADAAKEELAAAGMTEITCLAHQRLTPPDTSRPGSRRHKPPSAETRARW